MNGKKAKESRQLKSSIDKHFNTLYDAMGPKILKTYRQGVESLPLRKRLVVCYKIIMKRYVR